MKIANFRCRYDSRKLSFSVMVVNLSNSSPDKVVSAESVDTFKSRSDKFWKSLDVLLLYS